ALDLAPRNWGKTSALAPRGALGQKREDRQHEEVLHEQDEAADDAGQRHGQAQIAAPQPRRARPEERAPVAHGSDASELSVGVVHMKSLVAQHVAEHALRLRIGREDLAIDGEAAGGGLLRQVEKSEQRRVAIVDAQIVEPALAGGEPVGLKMTAAGGGGQSGEDLAAAHAEQLGVALLVERVAQ